MESFSWILAGVLVIRWTFLVFLKVGPICSCYWILEARSYVRVLKELFIGCLKWILFTLRVSWSRNSDWALQVRITSLKWHLTQLFASSFSFSVLILVLQRGCLHQLNLDMSAKGPLFVQLPLLLLKEMSFSSFSLV